MARVAFRMVMVHSPGLRAKARKNTNININININTNTININTSTNTQVENHAASEVLQLLE